MVKDETNRIRKAEDAVKRKEVQQKQQDIKSGKVIDFSYANKVPGFGTKNYVPQTVQVK